MNIQNINIKLTSACIFSSKLSKEEAVKGETRKFFLRYLVQDLGMYMSPHPEGEST